MKLSKNNFPSFLDSVKKGYNVDYLYQLPNIQDFPNELFDNGDLVVEKLYELIHIHENKYLISVSKRIIAILLIQEAREAHVELDVNRIWRLISESITEIPNECTISSIGSQGFLSIPLYKNDMDIKNFDFIRLHIWDDSLNKYMDMESCERFSIHSHSFYAKSWIITGKVINNRYCMQQNVPNTEHSLFTVQYNNSLNKVNQHSSMAVNTGIDINIEQISQELYFKNGTYEINAGDLHKSGHANDNGVSATFFSFTAKDGLVDKSFVVGPKSINDSTINRKMYIEPNYLIEKIKKQIKENV